MSRWDGSPMPAVTRRRFVALTGLAALGAFVLDAARKTEPAVAAAAPLLRPGAVGSSAGRCAHCGSAAHSTLSPACEAGARAQARPAERGAAPRGREGGAMNLTRRQLLLGAGAAAGTAAVAGALGSKASDVSPAGTRRRTPCRSTASCARPARPTARARAASSPSCATATS